MAIAVRPSGSAAGRLHRTPSCGWGQCGGQRRFRCLSLSLASAASWPSGAACGCPQARPPRATPFCSRCSTPRGSRWVLHASTAALRGGCEVPLLSRIGLCFLKTTNRACRPIIGHACSWQCPLLFMPDNEERKDHEHIRMCIASSAAVKIYLKPLVSCRNRVSR